MSNNTTTYNGWTNYETWCVHLWLSNEEGSYRYWREEAGRHLKEDREDARFSLARRLKSELEEASPLEEASLFSDLLNAALSEVDWHEVADAFLEDLEPDDEPDSETDIECSDTYVGENEAASLEAFERAKQERAASQTGPLFELGRVVSTPGALATLTRDDIEDGLRRHRRSDWGNVGDIDWFRNDLALLQGGRLWSAHHGQNGKAFFIVTDADRSVTTVLLPSEQ